MLRLMLLEDMDNGWCKVKSVRDLKYIVYTKISLAAQ